MPRGGKQYSATTLRRLRKNASQVEAEAGSSKGSTEKHSDTKSNKQVPGTSASNSSKPVQKKDTPCTSSSLNVKDSNKPCSSGTNNFKALKSNEALNDTAKSKKTDLVTVKSSLKSQNSCKKVDGECKQDPTPNVATIVCGNNSDLDSTWKVQRYKNHSRKLDISEKNIQTQAFRPSSIVANASSSSGVKKQLRKVNDKTIPLEQQQAPNREETSLTENQAPPVLPKKKKNKKGVSKTVREQRRFKREEATLEELYKPKDSHVHLLNPALFQKLKGEEQNSKQGVTPPFRFNKPLFTPDDKKQSSCESQTEFPTLESAVSSTPLLSFAACLSSSLPRPSTSSPNLPSTPLKQAWPTFTHLFPPPSATTTTSSADQKSSDGSMIKISETPVTSSGSNKKPSRRPITLNLDTLIEKSKPRQCLVKKQIAKKVKYDKLAAIRENPKLTVGNLLDSSGPVAIHRGKIRQKKKKPSKLKKSILKSRELRKVEVLTESSVPAEVDVSQDQTIDTNIDLKICDNLEKPESPTDVTEISSTEILDSICSLKDSLPDVTKNLEKHNSNNNTNQEMDDNIFKDMMEQAEQASVVPPSIPLSIVELVKLQMHSRKFRSYCDMYITKELHGLVVPLMKELYRLQDRIYKTDPNKLKVKKRYVNGLKDVINVLKLNKAQLIIMAPDIEPNSGEGGLDDKIREIISIAKEKNVPYIFSGNRYILGKCIMQTKSPVSAMAIIDKQSVEEQFKKVIDEAEILRKKYEEEFSRKAQEVMANGG